MNVLLVNPNCGFQTYIKSAPLGLLSIATYLKERGHCVRMYDRKIEKLSPAKAVRGFRPDAVGVSVASVADIHDGIKISRWFRRRGIPVVWGGQFSSLVPDMILREGSADYVVIEEGETTFSELLRAIENKDGFAQVKGLAYLEAGETRRTPTREFADLADMPVIDWSFIDPEKYFFPDAELGCRKVLCLYSSKGCSGRCAFCYNKEFHHSTCRKRPNEYVISEMEELATKHGMDGVFFVDDDMFGEKSQGDLRDFCERLRDLGLNVRWRCFTRATGLSREELQLMYEAGCRRFFCGVESGSPEILKRMRKRDDLAKLEGAVRDCNDAGIATTCGFVLGFPGETEEQLRETACLMKRLDSYPNRLQILMHFPFPGSDTYNELVESGRLDPPKTLHEWGKYKLREDIFDNEFNVPARDMHVLQAYFGWRGVFRKADEHAKRETARSTLGSSLHGIFQQNFFTMIKFIFSSAKYFLTIAWYAHAYPGVLKKYGLD